MAHDLARADHRVSWTATVTGALGLPLGGGVSLSGMLALATFSLRPQAAAPLIAVAARLAGWLDALVGAASRLPGARALLPSLGRPALIAYGLALIGTALALRRIRGGAPLALVAALIFAAAVSSPRWRPHRPVLRITFLSVGQGDSIVVELPGGETLLIDGGGSVVGSFDPGREVVAPFLRDRGLSTLRALVLSHPHPDHANGLPYVMARFPVEEFWATGEPCPLAACAELAREIEAKQVRRRLFSPTERELLLDGVRIEALYPLNEAGYFADLGENDNSLTLKLSYGSFSALLPGDLEAGAEARLLADPSADLRSVLLKAPHHGSDTSSTPEFVRRVAPEAVVFSVGPRNRFDFPRASVVARYREIGARLLRTDEDGAVTFESDGEHWSVTTSAPK